MYIVYIYLVYIITCATLNRQSSFRSFPFYCLLLSALQCQLGFSVKRTLRRVQNERNYRLVQVCTEDRKREEQKLVSYYGYLCCPCVAIAVINLVDPRNNGAITLSFVFFLKFEHVESLKEKKSLAALDHFDQFATLFII